MDNRKIIFEHGRAVGDAMLFSCGIRDFKLLFPEISINVISNFPEVFENNPYIDWSIKKGDVGVEYYRVGYPAIQTSNNGFIHFSNAFLLDMISQVDAHERLPITLGEYCSAFSNGGEKDLGEGVDAQEPFITWRQKYQGFCKNAFRQKPDIFLSQKEIEYNMIQDVYGIEKYWVIAPGGKSDATTKIWDWRKFQKVIDYFDGLLKFVIIGRGDHILEDGFNGAINLVNKTKIRDLFPLVYHADGCVSGVSFLMHLAGAMNGKGRRGDKPCVAIYGGREPTSFTWYKSHQILHTNGALKCCDDGGCWQSRVIPIGGDPDKNKRLCHNTVNIDGRTIQKCMDMITANDVIRAIERYYDGNIYSYMKTNNNNIVDKINIDSSINNIIDTSNIKIDNNLKEINILASLQSRGGGEQSALKIANLLIKSGWKVNFYPWDQINDKYNSEEYKDIKISKYSFKNGMIDNMKSGLPLLFYANDQIWDFCDKDKTEKLVEKSFNIIIGINYCNGDLPKCSWLSKSNKVSAVIFQNQEKRSEFIKDAIGFNNTELISLFGAIDLDSCLEIPQRKREKGEPLIVLKHGTPDFRKYITEKSLGNGEKIHIWQKNIIFEEDTQFYERLLRDVKDIRFEFMEAHSEIVNKFKDNKNFKFYKFDEIPVKEFLSHGHVYLHRTSRMWRDQYPRSVAEALAAGLPILGEPRDGVKDRIVHGNTGLYCIDYDAYLYSLKLLKRKENYRFAMGKEAKRWAKQNLNPNKWVEIIESTIKKNIKKIDNIDIVDANIANLSELQND
jgi:ADP-heptose:LPS heptosyltransferase